MRGMLTILMAALLLAFAPFGHAEEEVTVETPSERELSALSPEEFLAEVRRPLRADAWGEFTGLLTHKGKQSRKGTLRVRMTFDPNSMHTQIVLNDANVYLLEQSHAEGAKVVTKVERPPKEEPPSLFDFGVQPDDLTFSFIYWNFLEELPRQSSRLRQCRVMRLASPTGQDTVCVWFDAKYGFPMEAWWYHAGEQKPWRRLELKGAKRFENGLWFVKELRLEGLDWKTQVRFDHVELNPVGEK